MFNCITLCNSRKKIFAIFAFPGKFEFLVKSKMDPQQRYNSKYLPYLVEYITGYPLKVKSFQNIVMQEKPKGGFNPPPPSLYHGGGMN